MLLRSTPPIGIGLGLTAFATAANFNPIIPVTMGKESWRWFDVGAAVLLAACSMWMCPRGFDGDGAE